MLERGWMHLKKLTKVLENAYVCVTFIIKIIVLLLFFLTRHWTGEPSTRICCLGTVNLSHWCELLMGPIYRWENKGKDLQMEQIPPDHGNWPLDPWTHKFSWWWLLLGLYSCLGEKGSSLLFPSAVVMHHGDTDLSFLDFGIQIRERVGSTDLCSQGRYRGIVSAKQWGPLSGREKSVVCWDFEKDFK